MVKELSSATKVLCCQSFAPGNDRLWQHYQEKRRSDRREQSIRASPIYQNRFQAELTVEHLTRQAPALPQFSADYGLFTLKTRTITHKGRNYAIITLFAQLGKAFLLAHTRNSVLKINNSSFVYNRKPAREAGRP